MVSGFRVLGSRFRVYPNSQMPVVAAQAPTTAALRPPKGHLGHDVTSI